MLWRKCALSVLVLAMVSNKGIANDWWQFRGPGSNGIAENLKLPELWGIDSNVQWKTAIPGEGWSAPIVVGKRVFVTTAVSSGKKDENSLHDWKVICLDAETGNVVWTKASARNSSQQHVRFRNTRNRRHENRGVFRDDGSRLLRLGRKRTLATRHWELSNEE